MLPCFEEQEEHKPEKDKKFIPYYVIKLIKEKTIKLCHTNLQEDGHDDDWYQEEEELLDKPCCPQNPLTQAHHLHSLTDTSLFLQNKFLREDVKNGKMKK